MITVKEAVGLLKEPTKVSLLWDGYIYEIDTDNVLAMDAYGEYLVRKIGVGYAAKEGENNYELMIAVRPIKSGEVSA